VNLDESEDEAATSSKALKGKQSVSEDEEDDDEDEEDSEDEDDDEEEFAGFGDEDDQMSQGESDDEEDHEDDAAEISDPELPSDLSDEESNGDLDELDAFVDQIASEDKKRKTQLGGEEEADTSIKKKRRVLPVVPGPAVSDGSGLGLRSGRSLLDSIPFI
jgi:U3 small nucleolar RNA-associated protein 14